MTNKLRNDVKADSSASLCVVERSIIFLARPAKAPRCARSNPSLAAVLVTRTLRGWAVVRPLRFGEPYVSV